jgi:ankyrin repeat protein
MNSTNDNKIMEKLFYLIDCGEQEKAINLLYLNKNININYTINSDTALIIACDNNAIDIIDVLLKMPNIDVNYKNNDGYDALYIACINNFPEIVIKILNCKYYNIYNNSIPILFIACKMELESVANKLLEFADNTNYDCLNINYKSSNGDTALDWACINSMNNVAKKILDNKYIKISYINGKCNAISFSQIRNMTDVTNKIYYKDMKEQINNNKIVKNSLRYNLILFMILSLYILYKIILL